MLPLSLAKAITEPEKVIAPIGRAERHLDPADREDVAVEAEDAEGFRIGVGSHRDEHRGEANQRVKRSDELWHRGHLDATGSGKADHRAERDGGENLSHRN
jgi:hypothetical protein